jgi:hypothetical protein
MRRELRCAFVAWLWLAAGCLELRRLPEVTATPIDPNGGVARSPDGKLLVTFLAGSLDAPTMITIAEDRSQLGGGLLTPIYTLGPAAVRLSYVAKATLDYPAAPDPSIYLATFADGLPVRIQGSSFDAAHGQVSASLASLGPIVLVDGAVNLPCANRSTDGGLYGSAILSCNLHDDRANGTMDTAQATGLGINDSVDIEIPWAGGVSFYVFEVPAGLEASLVATTYAGFDNGPYCPLGFAVALSLLDSTSLLLELSDTGACSGLGLEGEPAGAYLTPGTYYVRAVPRGVPPLTYHLRLYLLGPGYTLYGSDAGALGADAGVPDVGPFAAPDAGPFWLGGDP